MDDKRKKKLVNFLEKLPTEELDYVHDEIMEVANRRGYLNE